MTDRRPRRSLRGDEDLTFIALRAGTGDAEAEAALVARTIDDVWRYCAHLVGANRADDATQATYLRALRSLPSYRGDATARTWLFGVARHTCMDLHRGRARRSRLRDRLQAQPDARTERLADLGSAAEAEDLLGALDPQRREAFVLTQLLGLPYDEAADLVGCPIGTIRSRVARARVDLLALLEGSDADAATGT